MKQRIEHENKYTVTSLPNKDYWDRHVLSCIEHKNLVH